MIELLNERGLVEVELLTGTVFVGSVVPRLHPEVIPEVFRFEAASGDVYNIRLSQISHWRVLASA